MKGGSFLLRDIKECMYDIEIEADFEKKWFDLVNDYNLHDKTWIISTYAIKKKWAACYMKEVLTLGMRSTQLSESLNSHFKSTMQPNVDILQFFKHFESVVQEKRANELSCVYASSHKLPRLAYETSPILIQMGKVYTHTVFELFQSEFKSFLALSLPIKHESDIFVNMSSLIKIMKDLGKCHLIVLPLPLLVVVGSLIHLAYFVHMH